MIVPGSVTLLADLSDQPVVNSVELTVGTPGAGVGLGVDVATIGVEVGILVLGAFGLLASAEPPTMLNIKASTSTAVRIMNRPFCFLMGIILSVTFLFATAYKNNSTIDLPLSA